MQFVKYKFVVFFFFFFVKEETQASKSNLTPWRTLCSHSSKTGPHWVSGDLFFF